MADETKLSGKSGRIKIGSAITITAAVYATGVVTVTAVAHGLTAGMFVLISAVVGMTDLNNSGKGFIVQSAADADTFTVNLTTSQTYTSGGTARRIIPITKWNMNSSISIADVPDSESGTSMQRIFTGFEDHNGDYEGLFYDGQDDALFHTEATAEFDIDANNYFSGSAMFDTRKFGVDVPGATGVVKSGSFKINGDLTYTRNAA